MHGNMNVKFAKEQEWNNYIQLAALHDTFEFIYFFKQWHLTTNVRKRVYNFVVGIRYLFSCNHFVLIVLLKRHAWRRPRRPKHVE